MIDDADGAALLLRVELLLVCWAMVSGIDNINSMITDKGVLSLKKFGLILEGCAKTLHKIAFGSFYREG